MAKVFFIWHRGRKFPTTEIQLLSLTELTYQVPLLFIDSEFLLPPQVSAIDLTVGEAAGTNPAATTERPSTTHH